MTRTAYVVLLVAALLSGCADEERLEATTGHVKRVIDGDTVDLTNGERVRYLMVDAPEITGGHTACYGDEARAFNQALVEDRTVQLRHDTRQRDAYGRALAFVFVDGVEVNTLLVERGYARVLHIPPNGGDRLEEFQALERQAKREGRGLWGCPGSGS